MVSSASVHWCSPSPVLDPAREFCAPHNIGLDPCSNYASEVGADVEWSVELGFDGLVLAWAGRGLVYVNPPYGREPLKLWARKICGEGQGGVEILTLTPSRTGSAWCQQLLTRSDAHLFWKGRLRFLGATSKAPFDSLVCYFGPRATRFRRIFRALGIVEVHPQPWARLPWCYELELVLGDGRRRWERSAPLTYARALGERDRWMARGYNARLVEAA
jgi:hypothetical protein